MDDKNTILCRCEDLTRENILDCIRAGYCQGRTCRMLIAQELSAYYKIPMEEIMMPTFRPPVKPIPMGVLADAYQEGGSEE